MQNVLTEEVMTSTEKPVSQYPSRSWLALAPLSE